MGHEIDFLAVGEESSGGDAIVLRYGNLHGTRAEQMVVVLDGGYQDSGRALVDFIKTRYGTDHVDIVVATHPDRDHISGLEIVLQELSVGDLLMHLPWMHYTPLEEARRSGFQSLSFSQKLEKSMQEASDLERIANSKGVPITEPFTGVGTTDGHFRVLGPSLGYYEDLLPQIASPESMSQRLAKMAASVREAVVGALVTETLEHETLRDDGTTTASNNSSVITLLEVDGRRSLFAADAGIPALEQAVSVLEAEGVVPGTLRFVQIPHHGSRRSVGPSVLDRLLGPRGQEQTHSTAFVSAPKKNPDSKHPSKKVTNAFRRRGYDVHGTQGSNKRHHHQAPARADYTSSQPIPFHAQVEEDSDG